MPPRAAKRKMRDDWPGKVEAGPALGPHCSSHLLSRTFLEGTFFLVMQFFPPNVRKTARPHFEI